MAKTAMAKDPKTPATSKRGNWKHNGVWVDKEGYKVDNYGKRLDGQKQPFVAANKNPFAPKTPAAPTAPAAPTTQQQIQTGMEGLVNQGVQDANQFNPDTFQQEYEPQFEQGMQRAYDNIYQQFERRNQERFGREQEQLQQSLVERGLDPNSPAYAAMTRQLGEQQNAARQEAQSAAWQAAQGYQQQGFNQATGTALLPGQVASPYLSIYGQQQSQQFTADEAEKQRRFQAEEAKKAFQRQRSLPRGSGGGGSSAAEQALANMIMGGYGPSGQSSSALNAGVTGAAAGIGNALTAGLLRPS